MKSRIFLEEYKEWIIVSFTVLATRNRTPKRRIIG
jgi:hypothetical protein